MAFVIVHLFQFIYGLSLFGLSFGILIPAMFIGVAHVPQEPPLAKYKIYQRCKPCGAILFGGYIRSVEALFVGAGSAIDEMITACHDGPRLARVDRIETEAAQGIAPARFEVKPTV